MQPEATNNFLDLKASAGSGKTYRLVEEYLRIALGNNDPGYYRHILAITFTNKAADEMKERIVSSLRLLAAYPNFSSEQEKEAYAKTPGNALHKEFDISQEVFARKAESVFEHMIHNYHLMAVSTIDKFVYRIIRAFARELRVNPDADIELDTGSVMRRAVELTIAKAGEDKQLTQLLMAYVKQMTAAEKNWDIEEQLLDISMELLREDVETKIEKLKSFTPDDFIRIQTTYKKEIKTIEAEFIYDGKKGVQLMVEAGVSDILYQGKKGIFGFFDKLSKGDLPNLNSYVLKTIEEDKWLGGKAPAHADAMVDPIKEDLISMVQNYQKKLTHFSNKLLIAENINALGLIHEVAEETNNLKEGENLVFINDFHRLISEIVLRESVPFIYERVGERYKHFMIDEFQDTSVRQWQNFLPLLENSLATGNKNLVVGDPKQAIYRWRGGDVQQFIHLNELYNHGGNELIIEKQQAIIHNYHSEVLSANWRSEEEVVNFNNHFFKILSDICLPDSLKPIYKGLEQMPQKSGGAGYVCADIASGEEVEDEFYLKRTEAIIKQLRAEGVPLSDITILARRNTILSAFAKHLSAEGIEVISNEGLILMENDVIRFITHVLRYVATPDDEHAKLFILKFLESENFHETFLAYSSSSNQSSHRYSSMRLSEYLDRNYAGFKPNRCVSLTIYEAVKYIIRQFDLQEKAPGYIQYFLEQVHQYSEKGIENIKEFLTWWEKRAEKASITIPEGTDAVSLMTFHKSKGLQFPVVIVPELNWSERNTKFAWVDTPEGESLPVAYVSMANKATGTAFEARKEEEDGLSALDRLNEVYVAFTRAEKMLYIVAEEKQRSSIFKEIKLGFEQSKLNGKELEHGVVRYETGAFSKSLPTPSLEKRPLTSLTFTKESSWREKVHFSKTNKSTLKPGQLVSEFTHRGTVIHDALAEIHHTNDIQPALERQILLGHLTRRELPELKKNISDLLEKPELSPYYTPEIKGINEQEILLADGTMKRPDRVVIKGNKATVIDYKTGLQRDTHIKQLRGYMHTLSEMGYDVVRGLLVYIDMGEVQVVDA